MGSIPSDFGRMPLHPPQITRYYWKSASMSQQETLSAIRHIKKTHENIVVGIGILIGMVLLAYFFTFAMFVDRASTALSWFQIITTILMTFM